MGQRLVPSSERGCLRPFFFKISGGIMYGQHWLNIKFEKSLVRVPFRILTKEEQKTLEEALQVDREAGEGSVRAKKRSSGAARTGRYLLASRIRAMN